MTKSAFISYRRADAKDFAIRLHDDLTARGIETWLDLRDMPSGDTFIAFIDRAIERADYFLLVSTPQAIYSDYCKDEWAKAIEKAKPIIPLLRIGRYEDLPREAHVDLNDARDFTDDARYTSELDRLIDQLNLTPTGAGRTHGVPDLPGRYFPRAAEVEALKEALTRHKTTVLTSPSKKVGVQGMGGVGKSVIAAAAARDYFVRRAFPDGIFWLPFGTQPDRQQLWIRLRNWLGGGMARFESETGGETEARDWFEKETAGKACLIVLDDVWNADDTAAFTRLGENSRLLVTSRFGSILDALDAHKRTLGVLSEPDARAFLAKLADKPTGALPKQAAGIIDGCGSLPLALAMIGAMVRGKPEAYWADALDALGAADLEDIAAKFPDYGYPSLFAALKVSIDALDGDLRDRYSDFAIFRDDVAIPEAVPVTFWSPLKPREVRRKLDELVDRNLLIRDEDGSLRIHDLQLAYLRKEAGDLVARHERLLNAYNPIELHPPASSPIHRRGGATRRQVWHTLPHDGYLHLYLAYHLHEAGRRHELHALLTGSPEWMNVKFASCVGDAAYLADLDLALSDYADPILDGESLIRVVELDTCRRIVRHRIDQYDDQDLGLLVGLRREAEAHTHALTRAKIEDRFRGVLSVYGSLHRRDASIPFPTRELSELAAKIDNPDTRSSALRAILSGLSKRGDFEDALTLARDIEDFATRGWGYSDIIDELTRQGRLETAQLVVERIEGPAAKSWSYYLIAVALNRQGIIDQAKIVIQQAMKTTEAIAHIGAKVSTLLAIAAVEGDLWQGHERAAIFDQALTAAETIEDAESKTRVFGAIVVALGRLGWKDKAEEVLNRTLDTAAQIQNASARASELEQIAAALIKTGLSELTPPLVTAIMSSPVRLWGLRDILEALAEHGQIDTAWAIARRLTDELDKSHAILDIGKGMVRQGQIHEVWATAQTIADKSAKAWALKIVTSAFAEHDQLEEAERVAASIEGDNAAQAAALKDIVAALIQDGQTDKASEIFNHIRSIAPGIESYYGKEKTLIAIAAALGNVGRTLPMWQVSSKFEPGVKRTSVMGAAVKAISPQAQSQVAPVIAKDLDDATYRKWILNDIVEGLLGQTLPDAALMVALTIDDPYTRSTALSEIALVIQRNGQTRQAEHLVRRALQDARSTASVSERALSFTAVAIVRGHQKQTKRATEMLKTALKLARTIQPAAARQKVLRTIAVDLARRGFPKVAYKVAKSISDSVEQANAVSVLAQEFAHRGNLTAARQLASKLEPGFGQAQALREIAVTLLREGQIQNAEIVVKSIDDFIIKPAAVGDIAASYARQGRTEASVAVISSLENYRDRDQEKANLAGLLAQLNRMDEAKRMVALIEGSFHKDIALRTIATAVANARRYRDALMDCPLSTPADFIAFLAGWRESVTEAFSTEVFLRMLASALRIVGWELPQWREIAEIVESAAGEAGHSP